MMCVLENNLQITNLFILEYVQSYLHEKELELQKVAVLMYKGER